MGRVRGAVEVGVCAAASSREGSPRQARGASEDLPVPPSRLRDPLNAKIEQGLLAARARRRNSGGASPGCSTRGPRWRAAELGQRLRRGDRVLVLTRDEPDLGADPGSDPDPVRKSVRTRSLR